MIFNGFSAFGNLIKALTGGIFNPSSSGEGLVPPAGYLFVIDDDGSYLIDDDSSYLISEI